ncbi:FxLYD domain-containing protein [Streptomyces sp. NPDC050548]|uniref:FxLYD domain-containing protein n=1 Tax=Streptomyces sp. NPDC050548 TaxID=3365629 RepID=UPI0037B1C96D
MAWYRSGAALTAVVAITLTALTGCSDDSSTSSVASKAASAVASIGAQATAAIASATAEAGRRLDEVKNGVDAKDAVKLGTASTDSAGRSTVEVTADNKADSTKSFAVQVEFKDTGGNLLDTVVVTVSDVPAGQSGTATARSNRKLSGDVKAETGTALRY